MKILHLLKSDRFSGAESVALTIMDLFPEAETIYASADGPIRRVVEQRGHRFYALQDTSAKGVRAAVEELQPDLIHAHDFSMASSAAWSTGTIPVVAHLHNNPPWLKKPHPKSLVFALSLPKIRQVISVSSSVEEEYLFRALLKGKNTVVGNVVDAEHVKHCAEEPCAAAPVDLVFLGRLCEPKNPLMFCRIVNEVKKCYPNVSARMIGDGELRSQVETYLRESGLEQAVELVGFQSNPYQYLTKSRIMLMPSSWEGFGLAAVEGLLLGKPVLCSGAGGLKDIVDESCGAICTTEVEYAAAVDKILQSDVYTVISQNAVERSRKFTDLVAYKNKIENVYDMALGKG